MLVILERKSLHSTVEADWLPPEDGAAQAPVGGVLRLPRYHVLSLGRHLVNI